jgi:ornithine decarboxylase
LPDRHSFLSEAVERALRVNETPALVVDRRLIRETYQEFCDEFSPGKVYFALKANPHPGVVGVLLEAGCDFEISSQGELELLLQLGVPPGRIISSNPVKDPAFVRAAHAIGIDVFVFDSDSEVEKLCRFAPGSEVYVRLAVSNEGSEWPLSKKFGVEAEQAVDLLMRAQQRGLKPQGITFHVGSQCTNARTWAKAIEKSKGVWDLATSKGAELRALNLGGGFPVEYTKPVPSLAEIAGVVKESVAGAFGGGVDVMVAPGRALVGDSGILVATVVAKAVRDGERWLYLDVGVFNGLMETVGGMKYTIVTRRTGPNGRWVLAGPSCDSFDVISTEAELPELEIGDRVCIMSAGAYTTAYASQFDGFPIPGVSFVE